MPVAQIESILQDREKEYTDLIVWRGPNQTSLSVPYMNAFNKYLKDFFNSNSE